MKRPAGVVGRGSSATNPSSRSFSSQTTRGPADSAPSTGCRQERLAAVGYSAVRIPETLCAAGELLSHEPEGVQPGDGLGGVRAPARTTDDSC